MHILVVIWETEDYSRFRALPGSTDLRPQSGCDKIVSLADNCRRDFERGNGPPDCTKSAVRAARNLLLKVGVMAPARRYRVSQAGRMPHHGKVGAKCLPDRGRLIGLCSKAQMDMPDQMVVKGN
jgi:hypothetical protein